MKYLYYCWIYLVKFVSDILDTQMTGGRGQNLLLIIFSFIDKLNINNFKVRAKFGSDRGRIRMLC